MKRVSTIGFLIIALIFYNCKNNKTPQDNLDNKETEKIINQRVENTEVVDTLEIEEEIISITKTEEIVAKEKANTATSNSPDDAKIEEDKVTDKPNVSKEEEAISKDIVEEELDKITETVGEVVEDVNMEPEIEQVTENVA